MKKYFVVGGGLAGLSAANALAGDGHRVVLLEQADHLGGRAATQQDRGYLLNFGPHALAQAGVAARTLRQWGVPFQGKEPDTSSASFMTYGGRLHPLILTTRALLTTRLFSAAEKWQAARILQQILSGGSVAGESIWEWIECRARSPRVRQFASMLMRVSTFTADLPGLSARAALAQFRQNRQHIVAHGARPHFHKCQRVAVVSHQIDFAFRSAGHVIARDEHVAMTPQVPVAVGFAANSSAARLQL